MPFSDEKKILDRGVTHSPDPITFNTLNLKLTVSHMSAIGVTRSFAAGEHL